MQQEISELLLKTSQSQNANIRKATAIALGGADSTHAKAALIKLVKDKVWQVKESAIYAIGEANIIEAADLLMALLGCENADSARKAILTWAAAKSDPQAAEQGAANPLGGGGKKKPEGDPWQIKKAAALVLSKLRPDIAVEPLLAAMDMENPTARAAAMVGLGNIKAPQAIDKLIEALSDGDMNIRKVAVSTLGRLRATEATESLLNLLKEDKTAVRIEAVIALNHIKPPEALGALAAVVSGDSNYEVRKTAATALGNLKNTDASNALLGALDDDNWMTRKAALDSLVNLKITEATEKITSMLADGEEDLAQSAAVGIIRLNQLNQQ